MSAKLQVIYNAWKNFELNSIQHDLDETAAQITQNQDDSDISRKKLVDQLKEFKKSSNDEIRKGSAPLIKSFQNEVDSLSKRSKQAELAYLKLYQKFLDIVDPLSTLEYCISLEKKVGLQADLEIENKTIRETLKEYNEEFKEVRNQEVTIKNLKEKLRKLEEQMENEINLKVKVTEEELISSYYEKEQVFMEKYKYTTEKLKESEDKYKILQQSFEQSQSELFEVKNKLEAAFEAKSEEIEILANDLELANQRVTSTQKELAHLKERDVSKEKTIMSHNEDETSSLEFLSLQAELFSKDKEISQLIHDLKQSQNALALLTENTTMQIDKYEDELNENKLIIANYEKKLKLQEDYEDIKRELTIIKSVEFDSIDELNSTVTQNSVVSKPLELLLLEKNKALQNDNTALKLSQETINTKNFELEKENLELKTLVSEQRMLVSQLENDLLMVQNMPAINRTREGSVSQTDFISDAIKDMTQTSSKVEISNYLEKSEDFSFLGNTPSATETLLSIVSAQRERFRYRNEELETEVSAKGNQILLLQNELDSLRGDNLKLYEKIRFLQSYQSINKSGGDSFSDTQYSNQYEKSLDPFMTFSQREKQRRYASLSPFEKITLSFGKFVLSNKNARTATFIYVSILHCLVFAVLYKLAFTESCKRDFSSDCTKKFAEHMYNVHGEV